MTVNNLLWILLDIESPLVDSVLRIPERASNCTVYWLDGWDDATKSRHMEPFKKEHIPTLSKCTSIDWNICQILGQSEPIVAIGGKVRRPCTF